MRDHGRFDEVRQEIILLLRAQLEALANLSILSDAQLADCYNRQQRVQELRDILSREAEWVPGQAADDAGVRTSATGSPAAVAATF